MKKSTLKRFPTPFSLFKVGAVSIAQSGATTLGSLEQIGSAVTSSANTVGWHEVPFSSPLQPGLYMVSVNIVSSFSYSPISYLGPASPSLLTMVAGSFTTNPLVSAIPTAVFSQTGFPNGFFWVDVMFTPAF